MPREVKWAISFLIGAVLLWFGWRFYAFLVVLHVAVCFVLMGVILLQSGSAADLAGAFGGAGSQTAFGPRGAATFLSRATTWCAIVFMMTSLTLSVKRAPTGAFSTGAILEETQPNAPAPKTNAAPSPAKPATPATPSAPAQQQSAPSPSAPAQPAPAPAQPPAQTPPKK